MIFESENNESEMLFSAHTIDSLFDGFYIVGLSRTLYGPLFWE